MTLIYLDQFKGQSYYGHKRLVWKGVTVICKALGQTFGQ